MTKLISQGAEAKIYLIPEVSKITKNRTPKFYRHPTLDKQIRNRRTKSESKILTKAAKVRVNVPKVSHTDKEKHILYMDYIEGDKLSEKLNSYDQELQFRIMRKLGGQVALLHENDIIHGDLTTSNTIYKDDRVYIIDFGLSFISKKIEDKAVDLHLIKQALEAKHFQNHGKLFENFTRGYVWPENKKVLERLKIVEKRGRYKH